MISIFYVQRMQFLLKIPNLKLVKRYVTLIQMNIQLLRTVGSHVPLGLWVHSGHWFPNLADHPNEMRELLLFSFLFFVFKFLEIVIYYVLRQDELVLLKQQKTKKTSQQILIYSLDQEPLTWRDSLLIINTSTVSYSPPYSFHDQSGKSQ